MSRFFSDTLNKLTPYTPGEQPQDMKYIKLNTNESPFTPSKKAMDTAKGLLRDLNLYPDPSGHLVTSRLALDYGVDEGNIILGNGSDELLFFSFRAFCDENRPALFADITYGFYPVFSAVNRIPYKEIPLREDFSVNLSDFDKCIKEGVNAGAVFIANPNAPTGKAISPAVIEEFAASHPGLVTVVDEAYVDFGGESSIPLTAKYDNILVIQTFSKSRSMAGARIGYAIGSSALIRDLNTIKYSLNPYNVNSMTLAAACGVLSDGAYVKENCLKIIKNRKYTESALKKLGFAVLPSKANFLFARHPECPGGELYGRLKERGILVRHFDKERISDYIRITIGGYGQMETFISTVKDIISART